jgi:electron transport complex protein RnfG
MTNNMLKTGLFLFVVAAISGTLLAFSESLTGPVIKQNQIKAEIEAQNEVLPSFEFLEKSSELNGKKIGYKVGFDRNGKVTGAVFKVSPKGFGGLINTMVGINNQGRVIHYKILSLSETPGLGSKLKSEKFSEGIKDLIENNASPIFKVKKDGGDVDAVTAATISSRAFCSGLNEALDNYNALKEQILSSKLPDKSLPLNQGGNNK